MRPWNPRQTSFSAAEERDVHARGAFAGGFGDNAQDVAGGCSALAVVVEDEAQVWPGRLECQLQPLDVAAVAPALYGDLRPGGGQPGLQEHLLVVAFQMFHDAGSEPGEPQDLPVIGGCRGALESADRPGGDAAGDGVGWYGPGNGGARADEGVVPDADSGGDARFVRQDRARLDDDGCSGEAAGPRGGLAVWDVSMRAFAVVVVVKVGHVGDADSVADADADADHRGNEHVLADGDVVTDAHGRAAVDLDGGAPADGHVVADSQERAVVDLDAQVSREIAALAEAHGGAEAGPQLIGAGVSGGGGHGDGPTSRESKQRADLKGATVRGV